MRATSEWWLVSYITSFVQSAFEWCTQVSFQNVKSSPSPLSDTAKTNEQTFFQYFETKKLKTVFDDKFGQSTRERLQKEIKAVTNVRIVDKSTYGSRTLLIETPNVISLTREILRSLFAAGLESFTDNDYIFVPCGPVYRDKIEIYSALDDNIMLVDGFMDCCVFITTDIRTFDTKFVSEKVGDFFPVKLCLTTYRVKPPPQRTQWQSIHNLYNKNDLLKDVVHVLCRDVDYVHGLDCVSKDVARVSSNLEVDLIFAIPNVNLQTKPPVV